MDVNGFRGGLGRNRMVSERACVMPQYTYKCKACGNRQVVIRPMNESNQPVLCEKDAFVMTRDFKADFGKQHHGDTYPFASYALGVSPEEVPAMMAFDKEHNIPTNYDSDGDPIMRSAGHRKKYAEAHGFYDRNAGYSDPQPKNR